MAKAEWLSGYLSEHSWSGNWMLLVALLHSNHWVHTIAGLKDVAEATG